MLACLPCKICWEKTHMAFVKIVGGSEIYNFRIKNLVHFYSNFWRKSRSNLGSANFKTAGRTVRRDVALRCRARALNVRVRVPPDAPPPEVARRPRPRAFPRRRAPRSGNPRPCAHQGPRRTGRCAPRTAGPSAAHRRTRAGRDGRATTASRASRRRHQGAQL
jgi:hypothetical protein